MTINIHETTLRVLTEDEQLIRTSIGKTYVLYPDEGKLLKNTLTGTIIDSYVGVPTKEQIQNYIEIDKE